MKVKNFLKSELVFLAILVSLFSVNTLSAQVKKVVVGVAPGPYGDLFKDAIEPGLKQKGYTVTYTQFSDYVQPNLALSNKAINVNLFQHGTYLKKFSADKGLKLSELISVPTASLGIYSNKFKTISEIKDGSTITIPNDATNLARALIYLESAGLIKIKPNIDPTKASERDITENPKKLKFKPIEAAQIPRTVDSVDVAVANGNFAISAGIYEKAIDRETLIPEYVNVIAVRTEDLDEQFVKDIKEIVLSDAFAKVINDPTKIYKDFQKPTWWGNR
ncbi:MAG: MetQ/NlpA family ABC transporter substrate-binding protein [Campylobacteraceae bacterium]